jgi:AcrR family transcriptional regulator
VGEGLREQKREHNRVALERAALRLFEERGFDRVSAGDIARSVNLSTRTFFRYFSTKDEVVFAPLEQYEDTLRQLVREHRVSDMREACAALLDFAERLDRDREQIYGRYRLIASSRHLELRRLEVLDGLSRRLAEDLARIHGGRTPDIRLRLLAGGIVAVVAETLDRWAQAGRGRSGITEAMEAALAHVRDVPPGTLAPTR